MARQGVSAFAHNHKRWNQNDPKRIRDKLIARPRCAGALPHCPDGGRDSGFHLTHWAYGSRQSPAETFCRRPSHWALLASEKAERNRCQQTIQVLPVRSLVMRPSRGFFFCPSRSARKRPRKASACADPRSNRSRRNCPSSFRPWLDRASCPAMDPRHSSVATHRENVLQVCCNLRLVTGV
jgi:hypothetical protein